MFTPDKSEGWSIAKGTDAGFQDSGSSQGTKEY